MANFLVVRRSPNWRSYDLGETVGFLRRLNHIGAVNLERPWPETLIVEFAALWDEELSLSYAEFRARSKEIALDSALHTGARVIFLDQWEKDGGYPDLFALVRGGDNLVFTDDDDWLHPGVFDAVETSTGLGAYWNFVFTGHIESSEPGLAIAGKNILKRPATDHLFTNNYAVKGDLVRDIGVQSCIEHYVMQHSFDLLKDDFVRLDRYLSAANRGPCSSTSIQLNRPGLSSRADIRAYMERYSLAMEAIVTDADTDWIRPYVAQVQSLVRQALRPV